MKKIIIGMLFFALPFIYMSNAIAGGKCPFGGSPNWQGVCDTTTDSGQSYFGPTLTQEEADRIGPAPTPAPTPTPPPAPETSPAPAPQPTVSAETLLMLALGMLSQNNAILDSLNRNLSYGGTSPSPSPSPTSGSIESVSVQSSSSTDQPSTVTNSESTSVEPTTSTQVSQRNIVVKPTAVDSGLIINKKLTENIFKSRVFITATKGTEKKVWSQIVSANTVKFKIPSKYKSWKISLRYVVG